MSFLGWNSDWAYGVNDGGGVVGTGDKSIFAIVGWVTTYFYRKTGHIYVGAFISAMLVTWIVVASQAIHFKF